MIRVQTLMQEGDGAQVVTLEEAKNHLNVTVDDHDLAIYGQIDAAISWAEDYTARPIREGDYLLKLDRFQRIDRRQAIRLQGYVSAVDSIQYRDSNGALQTIAGPSASPGPSIYEILQGQHSTLIREAPNQSWPELQEYVDNIRVTFTAGWTGESVPYAIKQGILLKVGDLHFRRAPGDDESVEESAKALLSPWKLPVW